MTLALILIFWPLAAWAEAGGREAEVRALKARLERLETASDRDQEGPSGRGLPRSVTVSGDAVFVGQGTAGNRPGDGSAANVRADLMVKARPTPAGAVSLRLLMDRGRGLGEKGLLDAAILGIPNTNVQYNSDIPHVVEAWYEQTLAGQKVVLTFGILDPTVYFDTNRFANDELTQFLAFVFVNNPGIDWGGDVNFYGPGARLSLSPLQWLSVSLGGFATKTVPAVAEGQQELLGFADEFERPFAIFEVDLKLRPLGREGNYRLYAWENGNDRKAEGFHTDGHRASWGVGGSFDQMVTPRLGAFLRWSKQDLCVGELDWHVSGGLSATGLIPTRTRDVAAAGYAVGFLNENFRQNRLEEGIHLGPTEQWLEAYYSCQATAHFSLSPDFQYVIDPGGEEAQIFIWGFRAQAVF